MRLIQFPVEIATNRRLHPTRQQRDRQRFAELGGIGMTFGPCTMPAWAGTSGLSDETIADLDAMDADYPPEQMELGFDGNRIHP